MKLKGFVVALLVCVSFSICAANKNMPGAFSGVSVEDDTVVAVAQFAVEKIKVGRLCKIVSAHSKVDCKILSAQRQVVNGTNYHLVLQLKNHKGKICTVEVHVYVPLPLSEKPMELKKVVELAD